MEREREGARRLLALLLSALAHQMRSASALECVCESSLTTDPPNHYHRNLIQTILSPFFIVCVCVCSSITYLISAIYFGLQSPLQNLLKSTYQILTNVLFLQPLVTFTCLQEQTLTLQAQVHAHTDSYADCVLMVTHEP